MQAGDSSEKGLGGGYSLRDERKLKESLISSLVTKVPSILQASRIHRAAIRPVAFFATPSPIHPVVAKLDSVSRPADRKDRAGTNKPHRIVGRPEIKWFTELHFSQLTFFSNYELSKLPCRNAIGHLPARL